MTAKSFNFIGGPMLDVSLFGNRFNTMDPVLHVVVRKNMYKPREVLAAKRTLDSRKWWRCIFN